jgi:polyhydroxybutyrate depolymerase
MPHLSSGLVCAALLLACDATDRPATSASEARLEEAPAQGACGIEVALPSGVSEHRLTSGGVERRFLVHLPPGDARRATLPVVFNLHGSGGSPEGQLATSGLAPLADAQHFALVAPAAVDGRWNVPPDPSKPDDVRFVSDMIDAVSGMFCVDKRQVYSTGFSGGGRMSSQLACDLSGRIGAIAAIGGIRFPGPCTSARPIPVLAFHGTGDEVNPYAGGGQPYWGTGVDDAINGWALHNGCTGPNEVEVAPAIDQVSFAGSGCTEVVLYRIEGFPHAWPGAILAGQAEGTANDLLWRFFRDHPLPER